MKYPLKRIGDYIEILSGYAFKSKDFCESGIPVIKIKNITPPNVSLIDLSFVPQEVAEANKKFELNYNDVLIALTGSHINQMTSVVGRVARVKYNEKTMLNQRVAKIYALDEKECNIDYVYQYLSQDSVKIALASKAGGAANQANISPSDVKNLIVPFPNIEVQNRIADVLSAYDNLIENNQKQIKLLEEAAQRLYKEWFVDLRFPGHENTKIVEGVPEGWEKGVLDEIAIESGKRETKENRNNYSYYLPIDCLPKKSLAYTTVNDVDLAESSLVSFQTNDIIFGAMRPYFHKVVISRDSGLTRTTCFVLNSRKKNMWAYLAMLMFFEGTVDYATQISVGTTMPYARWKNFKKMPVTIPRDDICIAFQKVIIPIIKNIGIMSNHLISAQQARDRLLPKLMSGELEV